MKNGSMIEMAVELAKKEGWPHAESSFKNSEVTVRVVKYRIENMVHLMMYSPVTGTHKITVDAPENAATVLVGRTGEDNSRLFNHLDGFLRNQPGDDIWL